MSTESVVRAQHVLDSPVVAPDGDVVVRLAVPDVQADAYASRLIRVPADGGEPVRAGSGFADSALSCDAGVTALLRAGRGDRPQLWAGAAGSEPVRLTDLPLGVSAFAVDGEWAYLTARHPEPGRYGTDEETTADAEAPRRITTTGAIANGVGYVLDRPSRLVRVPLGQAIEATGLLGSEGPAEPETVLALTQDVSQPRAAFGRVSALAAPEAPGRGSDLRTTVWLIEDGSPRALDLGDLAVRAHTWADSDTLLLIAQDMGGSRTDFLGKIPDLYVHRLSAGTTERITPEGSVELTGETLIPVDGGVLAILDADGSQPLVRIDLADGAVARLTGSGAVVTGAALSEDGGLVATVATAASAGDLFRVLDPAADLGADAGELENLEALTDLDRTERVVPQRITAQTSGGEVRGWMAVPAGDGPFPVVLNIHGGPFAQYTGAAFDETQVLVDAGYAVVWSNPRGSNGRGREWGTAVQADMAAPAAEDVLAVLDAALASDSRLDGDRLGVQGGSYGGYLTAMIVGSDHRFRGAIVERGYLVPETFIGTSDIGDFFSEGYTGTDPEQVRRQSPLSTVGEVRTPVLVMHSEQDLRCPLEQAQQYFAALRRAGKESELLIFPGENHELSRSGRPRHRVQRFDAVLDWWARHLGGAETSSAEG